MSQESIGIFHLLYQEGKIIFDPRIHGLHQIFHGLPVVVLDTQILGHPPECDDVHHSEILALKQLNPI
jgi:hypothetical protein